MYMYSRLGLNSMIFYKQVEYMKRVIYAVPVYHITCYFTQASDCEQRIGLSASVERRFAPRPDNGQSNTNV